ncbi:uncharacterized protein At3g06530 [Impatiens glandulifera]|uniref:uncharacterized protein At3g06530 n=1 Tax=Impatiens glandulifera TaxID=253017 RepID=UPI001FB0EB26|nr:uncharacterized protein At3g06530 [Impatiens glandulifera]
MASSIAAQLEAIKSLVVTDSQSQKRPFTRPSILFDPKKAADIDLDTILSIALSGLEVLISTDERFRAYRGDLFSHQSREMDRELMNIEENNRINASISSYLRLLSGYFQHHSAVKTLEYLLRRFKIHVYNMEDLILCALPYHDTHIFVRVVQLIDTRNSKWKFLDGVKASGASPPRRIIAQQCIRDLGVLEVLCNYATPTKKNQPSRPVVGLCTAVIVEALGSLGTIGGDVVKRVIPYVISGLQLDNKGDLDQKAGCLMIVGLLANKVKMSSKLVKSLTRSVAELMRDDAKDSADVQWFRMSFMALINLVQFQDMDVIPQKTVDLLKELRDLPGILAALTRDFNVDKFLAVLLDSLIEYSSSDDSCCNTLLALIATVPMRHFIHRIVFKILHSCMRLAKKKNGLETLETGSFAKKVLVSINKSYPSELLEAGRKFMENAETQSEDHGSAYDTLCKILDGGLDSSVEISDSKVWFALEHPKPEVRRSVLSGLNALNILKDKASDAKGLVAVCDAIVRRLHDDDLTVVQAALRVNKLSEIINPSTLLDALQHLLQRCISILMTSTMEMSLAIDAGILCMEALSDLKDQFECTKHVATMIFPLLLVLPKTQRLNLKAIELAKKINWPFYENIGTPPIEEKRLKQSSITSFNKDTVRRFAETVSLDPAKHIPWLVENCNSSEFSKTLFFLVLLDLSMEQKIDDVQFHALHDACYPILKTEWNLLDSTGEVPNEETSIIIMDGDCYIFLEQLFQVNIGAKLRQLNAEILLALFWRLLEKFFTTVSSGFYKDDEQGWLSSLQDFFVFFSSSKSKHVFHKHLNFLVTKSKNSQGRFLSRFFTEEGIPLAVQLESLRSFMFLCSQSDEGLLVQLLAEFPSLLVPLSSDIQDVRAAAMKCIESLSALWPRVNLSKYKTSESGKWSHFLGELLSLMVEFKALLLSDRNVLFSFFTSVLGCSRNNLLLPETIGERFEKSKKNQIMHFIVGFALTLPSFALLNILSLVKGVDGQLLHVKDVKILASTLLKRRREYHIQHADSCQKLSKTEVYILCLLLETCAEFVSSSPGKCEDLLLEVLQQGEPASEDPAVLLPFITVLRSLTNSLFGAMSNKNQEEIFRELVFLFRSSNGDIQNAAREVLLRLNITCSIISKMLDLALGQDFCLVGSKSRKKRSKLMSHVNSSFIGGENGEKIISFLGSLLDIVMLKKEIEGRFSLLVPLFKVLQKISMDDFVPNETLSSHISYIQQTLLLIIEDITASHLPHTLVQGEISSDNLNLLTKCARVTNDASVRNGIFSLFSTLSKVTPALVLDQIPDVVVLIGESTLTKWDNHTQEVLQNLISAIVSCWLSQNNSMEKLLQMFVNVLPKAAEYKRLTVMVHLLRTLGESTSLGSLLVLLFRSLVSNKGLSIISDSIQHSNPMSSLIRTQWEYSFATQLSDQFSCSIWLPALVKLIQEIGNLLSGGGPPFELLVAMQFISDKIQDPDIAFKLDSAEESEIIQRMVGTIMEHVVILMQQVDSAKKQKADSAIIKKEVKECMRSILKCNMKVLTSTTYLETIIRLLGHANRNVRKKALGLLSETLKDLGTGKTKREKKGVNNLTKLWSNPNDKAVELLNRTCLEILKLVEDANGSLKLAAIVAVEVLAHRFPSSYSIFSVCLTSITKNIASDDGAISSCCLRTIGTLINVLGPKALSELPNIMENLLRKCQNCTSSQSTDSKDSFFMSTLVALEAIVDKLGAFLNPYLGSILRLIVLHPFYTSGSSDQKLSSKSSATRKLICEKIPVRLLLPSLLSICSEAITSGESSLSIVFEMLADLVRTMDRQSVNAYHTRIFDACLLALDLRRQNLVSVKDIDLVEKGVIDATVVLTMKLTETMFKPLFIRTVDWSESNAGTDRAISFYALVNKLVESHRSLFVPYFKYLLDSSVRHLIGGAEDSKATPVPKKKKQKLLEVIGESKDNHSELLPGIWHLRSLVLSSLHKCFLYDTGSLKFLDSANFQVLLKPIVSQLVAEPPSSLEQHPEIPSIKEVDDLLVACGGQMAVAAGSDLLWKPLNHEVLMQTRSEKVRSRILGLRIVKYLVDNLKEEYLVLLPETIPFLGELLEDAEPSVKVLAQEILKEMENMSGESLGQYL